MKSVSKLDTSPYRTVLAFLLGWLLPGAGHLLVGEKTRGTIFLIAIALTFWAGVAIGGVKNTVNREQRSMWFIGQICAGGHTLAAMTWSRYVQAETAQPLRSTIAYGRAEEVSVVYTAISGMLNILILVDLSARLEQRRIVQEAMRRGPPLKA